MASTPAPAAPSLLRPTPPAAAAPRQAPAYANQQSYRAGLTKGLFPDLEAAVQAATIAYRSWGQTRVVDRIKVIDAIRAWGRAHAREMAERAVEESGLGRVEDKIIKNLLCVDKTPGPEILVPKVITGDFGLTLVERAPFGVIGAITPVTNPTVTVLNNGISMISGGNAVVFNVHPSARKTCNWLIQCLNEVIVGHGGPADLVAAPVEPTIKSAQALMTHPGIRLLVVTGGGEVVRQAMKSGKRVVAAGPGNPPAVVDETADVEAAGRDIVAGASFDNNIICILEKEVIAVAAICDRLKAAMSAHGGYELKGAEIEAVLRTVTEDNGTHLNRKWVGKNAQLILRSAGIQVGSDIRLAFAEVPESHPFVQLELMMPVLGLVRVSDVDAAIACAVRVEHGCYHTATMHSNDIRNLDKMARAINTSIFVKNAPSYAGLGNGGEGYTAWTIASPTGDGCTTAWTFTRERRCTLAGHLRIV
ncbi:MAG: aldehyde dehydrogenase EutE [Deltaproteobacteria bacterium]|nr:aldehyde dehydrogenase EutE [Deltaproteobacteria bacterium]